jgi:hypothetical protein
MLSVLLVSMLLFATLVSVTSSAEWKDASGEPSEKMVTAEAEADGFVLGTERSFNLEPRLFGLLEYSNSRATAFRKPLFMEFMLLGDRGPL